jgi:thiol-disulfide isomerase/thioredoxin
MMRVLTALVLLVTGSFAAEPAKIGEAVPKLKFTDARSLPRTLDDFGAKKAIVIAFIDTSCPVAQRYLPTLKDLAKEYKDVQFLALNANDDDRVVAVALQAVRHDIDFPFGKDFGGVCAKTVGITRTPEVAVLDGEKKLRYRGRIDDQYRLGGTRKEPARRDLKDALDAILAGNEIAKPTTEVDGCPITFAVEKPAEKVNYAEHVAPILKAHCWQCHQAKGSAPFELTTFKQASSRAEAVLETISDQRMPPWFTTHDFGPFINRRGMTDKERTVIRDWIRGGSPEGDPSKAPAAPKPPESKWEIGEPDKVLSTGEFELPAKGDIPYKYAVLANLFTEDTWVKNIQILPDNPRVLHHCNMAYAKLGEKFSEDNFITGLVPGSEPANLDEGVAIKIPARSILLLQMHYVSTGKPEKCTVSVGLRFPREVVQKQLHNLQLTDRRFAIPPGAAAHKVTGTHTLDKDVIGVGLFSHMHLRGKDMTFIAHHADGKDETLLVVPNYNFEWQIPYRWETGKKTFAKGTKLECIAHFDNSSFNPYNPDPKATVKFGLQTHSEMMIGYFFYTEANEQLNLKVNEKTGRVKE